MPKTKICKDCGSPMEHSQDLTQATVKTMGEGDDYPSVEHLGPGWQCPNGDQELDGRSGEDCRCTSPNHEQHKDAVCSEPATEPDGYCRECHDLAAKEWEQSQPNLPDLPPSHWR
jgi:hypothetical protein